MEGRTSFEREGYYVLYEDKSAGYSRSQPDGVEIVNADQFVEALVEGCRNALRTFAASDDNRQVYAFSLNADDYFSFYIYLNTLERFEEVLSDYQADNADYYHADRIESLKYNQGDWDFQLWSEHMGEQGRIIRIFEQLAQLVQDLDDHETADGEAASVIAFEAGIVKAGYQVLAMRAVMRLVEEKAFNVLDRTDDFIAFTSTGNDYIDYSFMMRQTIDPELFARVFSRVREEDRQFQERLKSIEHYSVTEALDYWFAEMTGGDSSTGVISDCGKSAFEVFRQLERYGAALAEECLVRLHRITNLESLERNDVDEVQFYIEALHFAGPLSEECAAQCRTIAAIMNEKFDDMDEGMTELLAIAR